MNGVADELRAEEEALARAVGTDDPPETEVLPGVFLQDFRQHTRQTTTGSFRVSTTTVSVSESIGAELLPNESTEAEEIAALEWQRQQLLDILHSPENLIKVIEADIAEIELQVFHLIRSNKEILEEMKTDPDPVYKEALEENIQVVLKKREKLKELRKMKEEIEKDVSQLPSLLYFGSSDEHPAPIQTPVSTTTTTTTQPETTQDTAAEEEEGIFL